LTATEWAGVALALVLIVCIAHRFELFDRLVKQQADKTDDDMVHDMDNNIPHDNVKVDDDNKHDNYLENHKVNGNVQDDTGTSNKVVINLFDIFYVLKCYFPSMHGTSVMEQIAVEICQKFVKYTKQ